VADHDGLSVIDTSSRTVATTIPVGNHPDAIVMAHNSPHLYVSSTANGSSVSEIDTDTNHVTTSVLQGHHIQDLAITRDDQRLYAADARDGAVYVIDTQTHRPTRTAIPATSTLRHLAVSNDGKQIYLSDAGSNTVSIADTQTNKIIGTIDVAAQPWAMTTSPDGTRLYVCQRGTDQITWSTRPSTPSRASSSRTRPSGTSLDPRRKQVVGS
jgi:YVTN family beta-propeller protein